MTAQRGAFPVFLTQYATPAAPILVAMTGGSFARSLEDAPNQVTVDRLMRILRGIFGASVPAPTATAMSRWSWNPMAKGSYSHIPPGGSADAFDLLAEPVADRLFFAGEATSRDHPGTVHGAYLSGLREAERVAERVRGTAGDIVGASSVAHPHGPSFPTTGPLKECSACH